MINKPTRIDGFSRSCIDHFFISSRCSDVVDVDAAVIGSGITDHFPIVLSLRFNYCFLPSSASTVVYKKIDHRILSDELERVDWSGVYNSNDTNIAAEEFLKQLIYAISMATETKVKKINSKNRKRKPWITVGIINSIKKRDLLKKISDNNPNDNKAKENFRAYRNKLNKIVNKAKHLYYLSK